MSHVSVLLGEAVAALAPERGGRFVDGTAGGGGHAVRLLDAGQVELLALDRDPQAVERVRERLRPYGSRAQVMHANFDGWREAAGSIGWTHVDGILLDLGFSSYQMDDPARGFSFMREGPLDMRLDTTQLLTAAELVNTSAHDELVRIFREYGEEPEAPRVARAIIAARPITTTRRLAEVVAGAVHPRRRHEGIHPATLVFQALRIAVNDELGALERVLADLPAGVAPGGRIAIISFHSLEDRMVKRRFRELSRGCDCPPELPLCVCGKQPIVKELSRKAVKPGDDEIAANPRARSARLRTAVRV